MAGATFGRKGIEPAAPAGRRAQFIAPVAATSNDDAMEKRRAAFLASERARAQDADGPDPQAEAQAAAAAAAAPVFVKEKSIATAYALWAILGMISAHRFYLSSPLTAIAQTALWYVSLMLFMAGSETAFYPLIAGGLWVIGDALLIPGLHRAANEKLHARAEAKAPIS